MGPEPYIWEMLLRLLAAVALGSVIGWERESRRKPAGLRTHTMVSLGSAAFTLLAVYMLHAIEPGSDTQRVDPVRLIQGVATGIGFVGAGTIIQSHGSVQGITTATTIWVAAATGVACGAGHLLLAAAVAALSLFVLVGLGWLERRAISTPKDEANDE
ncbi:MAG: MgtC/SapB family protein [Phycisphaeraceae bacterium]